jgi:glutamine synthetase
MPIIAEYIWQDSQKQYRSKYKTIQQKQDIFNSPWNYDGSSTGQANSHNSEIFLKPIYCTNHPLIDSSILVLCSTFTNYECTIPTKENKRHSLESTFKSFEHTSPTFGFEQEYFIQSFESDKIFSLDQTKKYWNSEHFHSFHDSIHSLQGNFYCSNIWPNILHRNITIQHYQACLKANIKCSGMNAEVSPSQWEFQIGPVVGIEAADQLHISRFLLERIAESHQRKIDWRPKPHKSPWNGSGLHTNFSNKHTMLQNPPKKGYNNILRMIKHAEQYHQTDLLFYGDNSERLTGHCETSKLDTFTWGVSDRQASIRIPTETFENGYGYFEDRRPASDADPYEIIERMITSFSF